MSKDFAKQGVEFYERVDIESRAEFVEERFLRNPAERERLAHLVSCVPEGVESLLDVGAGHGLFLEFLTNEREIRSQGVEISQELVDWGKSRGLDLSLAGADDLPFADQSFDMLVSSEVIEHLHWGVYERALAEFQRIAKSWILISVPFDERRNFCRCPYCGATVNPSYHNRSFKPADLESLFPEFELISWETISSVSALTVLKPYLPNPWPDFLVCPSCSYRASDSKTKARTQRMSLIKRMASNLPLPRRPRWMSGLYRRRVAHTS